VLGFESEFLNNVVNFENSVRWHAARLETFEIEIAPA